MLCYLRVASLTRRIAFADKFFSRTGKRFLILLLDILDRLAVRKMKTLGAGIKDIIP